MKRIVIAMVLILAALSLPSFSQGWNVELVDTLDSYWYAPDAVAVQGDYAYFTMNASSFRGLLIIDISDPNNVCITGSCPTPSSPYNGSPFDVAVSGNHVYIADDHYGLRVIDVTNPINPYEIGFYDTDCFAYGVDVSGDFVYVSYNYDFTSGGLYSFDVRNPANPVLLDNCYTPGRSEGVAVCGNYAYTASWDAGLRIIDISDPFNMYEVGFCNTPAGAYGVAASMNYAYVAATDSGLRIIDITDPSNPVEVGFHDTPGWAQRVAITKHFAFVADMEEGFRVICTADPTNPFETGYYVPPGNQLCDVAVDGYFVYAPDDCYFGVFDCTDAMNFTSVPERLLQSDKSNSPNNFILLDNHPNPFNNVTVLTYNISQSGDVNLAIYSLLGHRICTLRDGFQQAGHHTITWDASDVSSGIYFARLNNGVQESCTKMILLK